MDLVFSERMVPTVRSLRVSALVLTPPLFLNCQDGGVHLGGLRCDSVSCASRLAAGGTPVSGGGGTSCSRARVASSAHTVDEWIELATDGHAWGSHGQRHDARAVVVTAATAVAVAAAAAAARDVAITPAVQGGPFDRAGEEPGAGNIAGGAAASEPSNLAETIREGFPPRPQR